MPAKADESLGNRELVYECCCDECDYFLLCFPEEGELVYKGK